MQGEEILASHEQPGGSTPKFGEKVFVWKTNQGKWHNFGGKS